MIRTIFLLLAIATVILGSPIQDDISENLPGAFFENEGTAGRIVGGSNAVAGQFPYQVSLRTPANFHFCGGVIISNDWAITAAHCIINRGQTAINVVVGSHLLQSGGVVHQSRSHVSHPDYDARWISNDVGAVQTATPIVFTANVQAIAMSSGHVGVVNAIVSGWGGTTVNGGPAPNNLQWLRTTTLTNADCRARHTTANAEFVFDHKICTFTQAGEGICQGDSGGPLVANNQVIGTVSWNIPCARGRPDAFDRVSYFREWYLQNTGV
ncbi:CLUMA_CG006569, isoform A [Clunio marinus]|uniref:CLUMA_CG006569, isoform A n=1 Tax=Clunio marinus TaxID=568069 RepID=A0A1J1HZI6_9DIPT|nr:CLUMA_CG006569, isoform A [Clunio marinus]